MRTTFECFLQIYFWLLAVYCPNTRPTHLSPALSAIYEPNSDCGISFCLFPLNSDLFLVFHAPQKLKRTKTYIFIDKLKNWIINN